MKQLILSISLVLLTITSVQISASKLYSTKTETVYICTGGYSKKYHSSPDCRGLDNCKGQIIEVSLYDAVNKYYRTPCKVCE